MTSERRNTIGVFVGNLPQHSSEVNLGQLFSYFGAIDSIHIKETKNNNTKIAFINFLNRPDAERAIKERNGYVYCGRTINVSFSSSAKNREKTVGKGTSNLTHSTHSQHCPPGYDDGLYREEEIVLSQVVSPVSFYAHLLRHKHDHRELSVSLAEICPKQSHLSSKPITNKIYAAKFSEDGQWYRCKVLSNDFHDKSKVHYIDYGNSELVSHTHLVNLPNKLLSLPALAFQCHLGDLVPVDPKIRSAAHREGMAFLQTQLQERIVVVRLNLRSDGTYEINRLVLGNLDLHREILRLGFACRPSMDFQKGSFLAPTKPLLERVNGYGNGYGSGFSDNWIPDDSKASALQAKVEELELRLSQEQGKVKALTAEVQRLTPEKKPKSESLGQMDKLLVDLERICTLRRQIPTLQEAPDFIEDALKINRDNIPEGVNKKEEIMRVQNGLRDVYGDLLQMKSLKCESFPMPELAAYYRRLKQERKKKGCSLASKTDAARFALADISSAMGQALMSGKSCPCPFTAAVERLRRCLAEELKTRALESSDVTVLSVTVGLLDSALGSKLQEEDELHVLAQQLTTQCLNEELLEPSNVPLSQKELVEPVTVTQTPSLKKVQIDHTNKLEKEDDNITEDDSGDDVEDLSSLRQKICSVSIIAK